MVKCLYCGFDNRIESNYCKKCGKCIGFDDDVPIKEFDDDILGRENFSKELAERIINYNTKNSVTIGLSGKWGLGKTSIINMVEKHIKNNYIYNNNIHNVDKPIIFRFNPWNIVDQDKLISLFFKELIIRLEMTDYDNLKTISEKLEIYVSLIEPGSIAFPPLWVLIRAIKKYISSIKNYADYKLKDISGTRKEIENSLENQNHKIIIIIEDIDRLNNKEIWQIFQLIKLLANFPKIVYLIEFDRDIVARALDNINFNSSEQISGYEYLEKIVNIIFEVPAISEREIKSIVREKLGILFDNISREEKNLYEEAYNLYLKYYFKNIRDVKRFFNTFHFIYGSVRSDVNLVDFILITAFQVFTLEVYNQVKDNKYLFTYTQNDSGNKEDDKERIKGIITDLNLKYPKFKPNISKTLRLLFPRLDDLFEDINYDSSFHARWNLRKRICIEDNFDTYFKFSVPSWGISQSFFDDLINSVDSNNFSKVFTILDMEKKRIVLEKIYMDLIHTKSYKFNENQIKTLVNSLIYVGDSVEFESSRFDIKNPVLRIYSICAELIYLLNDDDKGFEIIKDAISNSKSIYTLTYITEAIFENTKTKEANSDNIAKNLMFSNERALELTNIASLQIEEIVKNSKLNQIPELLFILTCWNKWNNPSLKNFVDDLNENRFIELVKFYTIYETNFTKTIRFKHVIHSLKDIIDLTKLENGLKAINNNPGLTTKELKTIDSLLIAIKSEMES